MGHLRQSARSGRRGIRHSPSFSLRSAFRSSRPSTSRASRSALAGTSLRIVLGDCPAAPVWPSRLRCASPARDVSAAGRRPDHHRARVRRAHPGDRARERRAQRSSRPASCVSLAALLVGCIVLIDSTDRLWVVVLLIVLVTASLSPGGSSALRSTPAAARRRSSASTTSPPSRPPVSSSASRRSMLATGYLDYHLSQGSSGASGSFSAPRSRACSACTSRPRC